MTTSDKINFQISHFCYCDGCMGKLTKGLRKLGDLSVVNKAEGKFAISTTNHRREIKQAVEDAFDAKKEITFEERRRPTKSLSIQNHYHVISNPPIQNHYHVTNNHYHYGNQESPSTTTKFLEKLMISPLAKDVQSVEYMKVNFRKSEDRSASHRSGPPKTTNTIIPSTRREPSRQASRRSGAVISDYVPPVPRLPSARSRPQVHQPAIGPPPGTNADARPSARHQGAHRTRTTKP